MTSINVKVEKYRNAKTNSLRELAAISTNDVSTFYEGANLAGVDVSGQDLTGMSFHGCRFEGLVFDGETKTEDLDLIMAFYGVTEKEYFENYQLRLQISTSNVVQDFPIPINLYAVLQGLQIHSHMGDKFSRRWGIDGPDTKIVVKSETELQSAHRIFASIIFDTVGASETLIYLQQLLREKHLNSSAKGKMHPFLLQTWQSLSAKANLGLGNEIVLTFEFFNPVTVERE